MTDKQKDGDFFTYIQILRATAEYLEGIEQKMSILSGNKKESILECFARIAKYEKENPLFEKASAEMQKLSNDLCLVKGSLFDVQGWFDDVGTYFNLRDEEGEWLHTKAA